MEAFLIRGLGPDREGAEREMLESGIPLPLCHRSEWAENLCNWEPWFVLVRNASGRVCGGVAIDRLRSHALLGYVVLVVKRFGGSLPVEVCKVALTAIARYAKNSPRVLRIQVNIFSRDRRAEIAEILKELEMREVQPPSSYRYTLVIDLKPTEEEILASFNRNARKRIRELMALSLRAQTITDPAYANRLEELQKMALERTRGQIGRRNWRGALKLSHRHPNLSTIIGVFADENVAPENMMAFGWACNNGDHVEYCAAGTQRTDDRIPFGYLSAWKIVQWAKTTGAEWFDMGGVTLEGDASPLEGISRFKRYFSREVVEVGAEWSLERAPVLVGTLRVLSNFRRQIAHKPG
jgi:hypothetical protein